MKITVNLDTHSAATVPSPLRIKAASQVPLQVAFTRGSADLALPQGTTVEFTLKTKGKPDAPALVRHADFSLTAGNLFSGLVNTNTADLLDALGLGNYGETTDDQPSFAADAEVAWSFSGEEGFRRSQTFPVTVEAPLYRSGENVPSPAEAPYPPATDVATHTEVNAVGSIATAAEAAASAAQTTANQALEIASEAQTLAASKQDALSLATLEEAQFGIEGEPRLWTPERIGQAVDYRLQGKGVKLLCSVQLTEDQEFSSFWEPIRFDSLRAGLFGESLGSEWSGYNPGDGLFYAPETGLYLFVLSLTFTEYTYSIEDLESIAFQARINDWEDENSARIFDANPTPRQTVFATFVESLQAGDTWGIYTENRPHIPKSANEYFWQDYGHNKLTIAALK